MNVQERTIQLMKQRNWTFYRLAKEANLPHSTISNVFSRNYSVSIPILESLCRAFNITPAQFFSDDNAESMPVNRDQLSLIHTWTSLTADQRACVLKLMESMSVPVKEDNQ